MTTAMDNDNEELCDGCRAVIDHKKGDMAWCYNCIVKARQERTRLLAKVIELEDKIKALEGK